LVRIDRHYYKLDKLENVVLKEYVEKCMEVINDYSKKKNGFLSHS
jgi:hypothetical protein